MGNFHSLEVVHRGSETQLQLGENLKKDNLSFQGLRSNVALKELMKKKK